MVFTSKPARAFQGIRPAKINFYLRSMREMGFDSKDVLQGTNITEKALKDSFALVQIPDYIQIVSNMMEISRDDTLAFKLGDYLAALDLGVLGCAFSASQNVKQGMDIWQRYNRLFFGDLISVRPFRKSRMQYFEFIPQVPLLPHLLQFFMEEKIGVETALYTRLNDCLLESKYFSVTYPRPKHGDLYDDILQLETEFSAPQNLYGINYRDENYHKVLKSMNPELLDVCLEHLDKISSIAQHQTALSPKVRQFLMERLPETPQLPELAETFNMSRRTFCRNLELEQTSYKNILAEVRADLAKNYLLTTTMSVDKIALQLGFEDTGSLRRVFRQWTGSTMKQYREKNRSAV